MRRTSQKKQRGSTGLDGECQAQGTRRGWTGRRGPRGDKAPSSFLMKTRGRERSPLAGAPISFLTGRHSQPGGPSSPRWPDTHKVSFPRTRVSRSGLWVSQVLIWGVQRPLRPPPEKSWITKSKPRQVEGLPVHYRGPFISFWLHQASSSGLPALLLSCSPAACYPVKVAGTEAGPCGPRGIVGAAE